MNRSSYTIQGVRPQEKMVYITDDNIGRSVTNDAENVVAELNKIYPNYRIFYQDSMGDWDELDHKNGVFKGFKVFKGDEFLEKVEQ